MMRMVKEAIAMLHELPQERQETIARAILDFASHDDGIYHLTDKERAEIRAGLGEVASDEEVAAICKRFGLGRLG